MSKTSPQPRRFGQDKPEEMSFGSALDAVVDGKHMTRASWQDQETYLLLSGGALHIRKSDGTLHTLIIRDGDITATDWIIVRDH